jgi:uncharacterized membrane protein
MRIILLMFITALLVGFAVSLAGSNADAAAADGSRSGEEINWQVISSGGKKCSSENYVLNSTAGQVATGYSSSDNYGLGHGIWQLLGGASECECKCVRCCLYH